MVRYRLLTALIALYEARSVTDAAARMNITQPAMSANLRQLRDHFSDGLFVRSAHGLIATERADQLFLKAKEIVTQIERFGDEAISFEPLNDPLHVRISASDYVQNTFLVKVLRSALRDAPNVDWVTGPLMLEKLVDDLENDKVDFSILPDFLAPPTLQMRRLFEESFVYLSRRNHPLTEEPLTIEALSQCSHVQVVPGPGHQPNRIDRIFTEKKLRRRVKVTLNNYGMAADLVRKSDLVVLYPNSAARLLGKAYAAMPVPFAVDPVSMSLVWHPRKQSTPSHRWVRDYMAAAAKSFVATTSV